MTAWQALFDRGGLQRGQTAVIAGAAGGVGHFAVQLARHADARAIGTGSGRNRDFALGLGADEYVDYTQQNVQRAEIASLVAAGDVHVELAELLPLAQAPRAHELSEPGHTRGKIVLTAAP